MRYCFITEEQLEYILKEGDCYLDKTDTGSDAPIDSCRPTPTKLSLQIK